MTASKASLASGVPAPGGRYSFVARQPILTPDEKGFGYELFFRDGVEDYFHETDPDAASRRTLDTSLQVGLEVLCDGRRGFVNCTRDVLLKDYMTLLPSTLAVAEVLESVPPDDLVVAALQRLKQAGYLIALDDFAVDDPRTPLTEMAEHYQSRYSSNLDRERHRHRKKAWSLAVPVARRKSRSPRGIRCHQGRRLCLLSRLFLSPS